MHRRGAPLIERHASIASQASQNNTEHTEKDQATERTEKKIMALRAKCHHFLAVCSVA
jgi:hypothetical protein